MSDLATKSIRFPAASYIGFNSRPHDKQDVLPLGFMTEDGTDKAAEKRKSTVDRWAGEGLELAPRSLPNTPMVGFRLSRSIKRDSGWGSGNVKWRIEDPRGFELEITSPNLAQIITSCVIENGEILDECMWARLAGDNVLVPTGSDLYRTTKTNSERMKMSVKPSSVKIGNRIVLQNGVEGIYCGKMYNIRRNYDVNDELPFALRIEINPKHIIMADKIAHHYAGLKVAAILDDSTITLQEAEQMAWSSGWITERMPIPKIERRLLDPTEVATHTQMVAQIEAFDNEWCRFTQPNTYNNETVLTAIHKDDLDKGVVRNVSWYGNRNEVERLKAAGVRLSSHYYHHNRETKSGYIANLDRSKLIIEALFRTWVTPAGNTFVVPLTH